MVENSVKFNWCTFAKITSVIFGGYVILNLLLSFRLGAVSIWQLKGYIDGLVRSSGDAITAESNLSWWKDYWTIRAPEMQFLIDALYNYGLQQTSEVYGSLPLGSNMRLIR